MPKKLEPGSHLAPMVIGIRDQTGTRLYRRVVVVEQNRKGLPVAKVGDPVDEDKETWAKIPPSIAESMIATIGEIGQMRANQQHNADKVGALYHPKPESVIALLWRGDAATLQQLLDLLGHDIDTNQRRRGAVDATPNTRLSWARTSSGSAQVTIHELNERKRSYSPGAGWWVLIPADGELSAMNSIDFANRYERAAK